MGAAGRHVAPRRPTPTDPPHVLHLLPSLNLFGGTPRKVREYLRRSRLGQTVVVTGDWGGGARTREAAAEMEAEGLDVVVAPAGRRPLAHLRILEEVRRSRGVRIIQSYFSYDAVLAQLLKRRRPELVHVAGFVGAASPSHPVLRAVLGRTYRGVDHVTHISEYVRRERERAFPVLARRPTSVIHNGVVPRLPDPGTEGAEALVVSVSGLNEHKNLAVLLEAVEILRRSRPEARLMVLGEGPLRERLEARVSELGLEEAVALPGYVEHVGRWLGEARVYAHPADREGFGIAVVEAMLGGKAVVVSDAGALPELVEHEVDGLVVPPYDAGAWADALDRLIRDPSLARRLGEAAHRSAWKRFGVEAWTARLDGLYRDAARAVVGRV